MTLGFRPLRAQLEAIPALFARTLAALGMRYDLEPPTLSGAIAGVLSSYPWPLNFEELIAVATRCLVAASGRIAEVEDLGLRVARRVPARKPAPRQRPAAPEAKSPGSLDVLIQDLAHEIKNPLVSIKTFTQLLPERHADPEFRNEYHRIVAKDVARIDAVLEELTRFARLREPVAEPVDVGRVLRKTLEAHQAAFAKTGIEVVPIPARPGGGGRDRPRAARLRLRPQPDPGARLDPRGRPARGRAGSGPAAPGARERRSFSAIIPGRNRACARRSAATAARFSACVTPSPGTSCRCSARISTSRTRSRARPGSRSPSMTDTEPPRKPRVLVVDDEPSIRESLRIALRRDYDVAVAGGAREALAAIDGDAPTPSCSTS